MQTPDSKIEDISGLFREKWCRHYIDEVLVELYQEEDKPSNAVNYVKQCLGSPNNIDVDALQTENEQLKKKNAELIKIIEELDKRASCKAARDVTMSCWGYYYSAVFFYLVSLDLDGSQ
ncbi:unnamed protein product [Peronospora destructor]|uniref:Uncharacterized protein n=1 Tax=Peronospora destructor TaxID=86335 RepID=A0AAV0VE05_9STRA|nr:unnamed protein product [Peronospora destructor]